MRSSEDIIKELRKASEGALLALLVIAFDGSDKGQVIPSKMSDQAALNELEKQLAKGGIPVGLVRVWLEGTRLLLDKLPFPEYKDEPDTDPILQQVSDAMKARFKGIPGLEYGR